MSRKNIENIYSLSPMQQGMLFHTLYQPGSYFVQLGWTIRGGLDPAAFARAWQGVVDRHPILRTAFVWERLEKPMQVVRERVKLPVTEIDLRGLPPAERDARVRAFVEDDRKKGFVLTQAPLMRIALLRLEDDAYRFVWSRHHLLLDGWSTSIVLRDVFAIYNALLKGKEARFERGRPFGDYIAWLNKQDKAREEAFWRGYLKGLTAPTPLGLAKAPSGTEGEHFEQATALLEGAETAALQAFARQHQITVNTLVQCAWALLLARYSGEHDVVFGATFSGRSAPVPGLDKMVGLFINSLPIRVDAGPERTVIEVCKALQAVQNEVQEHEHSSLVEVQRWTEIPRSLPIFDSLVVFENYPVEESVQRSESALAITEPRSHSRSNFPLMISATLRRALKLTAHYDLTWFDRPTIDRILGHLRTVLGAIAEDASRKLEDVPLLAPEERAQVVEGFNRTDAPYPPGCAHDLFAARAAEAPSAIALEFEEEKLTYRELDERTNQLARYLRNLGVGPEVLVGVSMRRSIEAIVAIVGVLKAGGAWVPLDPDYPEDRLAFMLEDAGIGALLTEDRVLDELPIPAVPVVCLDSGWDIVALESAEAPEPLATTDGAAYVIYTSGSTGRPKGVVVTHRGLGNLAEVHRRSFGIGPGSRVIQFASMNFDASVWETMMALLNGATLVLAPAEALLPGPDLLRTLSEKAISIITLPPSALAALPVAELPALRTIVVAGEACSPDLVDRWAAGRQFIDAYGPTESTVCATMGECAPGGGKPTIGRPIANFQVYVLDAALRPVPIGVPGEIHIGGVGLARGYHNRPDLTAERFVASPFRPGEELYKSGDLGRWRANGAIDFIGRIDHQVKIRGFRIELGEIDAVLSQHPLVADAIVIAREDRPGDRRLVGYVVPSEEPGPSAADLRAFLGEKLPEYMVPAAFVTLAAMPLTPNGKIDRRALPAPEARAPEAARVPARNPVEEMLVSIWGEVLDAEGIGVHDNFFELGGHSLLATQVMSRVTSSFGVDLPLLALFEAPTVAGLAEKIDAAMRAGEGTAAPPIEPSLRDGDLELSFSQERLWFLEQLEPGSAYLIPLALRLGGALDAGALERAIDAIVARHESLRTTFAERDGKPVQIVHPSAPVGLPLVDLSFLPEDEREAAMRREIAADAKNPMDLARGPLLRARLLALGEDDHVLVLTMHHIVTDGWSNGILLRELAAIYGALVAGQEPELPELPVQYADYARWQRRWLQGDAYSRQLDYWRQRLAGAPAALDLPTDRPRPAVPSHRGAKRHFTMPPELLRALKDLSRREGTTLFMTLLAAFDVLLARHAGQDDVVVGTPIANRTQARAEEVVGFFVNTLVLRAEIDPESTFRDLLARVRATCLGAYAHQDMPFERLVEELQPVRDTSRSPLFQVLFAVQNAPQGGLAMPGLEVRPVGSESTTAKFDLSLTMVESAKGLAGSMEYAADLFDAATVDRLIDRLRALLESIAEKPARKLRELSILPEAERRKVLVEWNDTAVPYPTGRLIHELFAEQAAKTPDAVALEFEAQSLTYRELDQRTNQLAHALRKRGIGPDSLVGVCMERSLEMVVALHATLKAGGAYVPLDPEYPRERLAFMLEDARPSVILTQAHLAEVLPPHSAELIRLDSEWSALAQEPTDAPARGALTPDHLAYVIYTSGSTGKPKGAMNAHRGILNRLQWMQEAHRLDGSDRVLQKTPFSFDVSVWEFFWPLMTGARLVVARPQGHKDPAYLASLVEQQGITTMHFVPSMLQAFLADLGQGRCPSLRRVFASGEALPPPLVDAFFAHLPKTELHNLYGPTEAAVDVTAWACAPGAAVVPIGKPIANTRIYLLDEHLQPVPAGVRGELYIGGVQVARGYLNRAELTAERFLDDPFTPGGRLYRTGDVARWLPDGSIEYLGRADFQVKLRGFRIELGEIESVLAQHPSVRECVVMAREDQPGDKRLVGYVVGAANADELRAHLKERLPEHMVPGAFVVLEALPLTASGKVDRKALPAPERGGEGRVHVAPRGPVEDAIARVFAEVLRIGEVGAHDGFFELGGHSLLATQAIARIRAALGVELPLRAIFEAPTVAELATRAEAALRTGSAAAPLTRVPREGGKVPLSFSQERLWFLAELEPDSPSYLIPSVLRLEGELDAGALARALDEVVRRHEALRTTFASEGGKPVAIVHPEARLDVPVVRWPDRDPAAREQAAREAIGAELRRPFDLAADLPIRARIYEIDERDHVLLLVLHHIASDGWSQGVLHREIGELYGAFAEGRPSPLPDLPIQYADYAAWQRAMLSGEALDRELAYWRQRLDGAPHTLDLPTDRPRPATPSHRGAVHAFALPEALSAALRDLSRREGATLFMTLLAAFDVLLYRYTGQSDLLVGSPIANRTQAETERLIGFFVNTLVLRSTLSDDDAFVDLLRRVRAECLGAYAHQHMPFERLVQELQPERDASRSPLFQVAFVLQNAPREPASLRGLGRRGMTAGTGTAKFDLTLVVIDTPGGLRAQIEYATDLFDAATVERMAGALRVLLEGVAATPGNKLGELPILGPEEEARIVREQNRTAAEYPRDAGLAELFQAQAARTPDAVAIAFDDGELTYRELDARSNRLAHHLASLGVGRGSLVGLATLRSTRMLVGMLGIVKAGGAYVPLDPDYPAQRLAWMIEDAGLSVVVTEAKLAPALPGSAALVRIDADWDAIAERPAEPLPPRAGGADLAYVIYTSGSTGTPKGACIPQRAVSRLVLGTNYVALGPDDRIAQASNASFDAATFEIWGALLHGGRLVGIAKDLALSPRALAAELAQKGVTTLFLTTALFNAVVREVPDAFRPLRQVLFGGEAVDPQWVRRALETGPPARLLHVYGPTETTTFATYHVVHDVPAGATTVPIGKAIANTTLYVLDRRGQPVPIGVPGELHIGGDGVARGYLNRPELTAEKFVIDRFSADPEARLYRTGDLVRWSPDGDVVFLGRLDHQVKLRGFRIELGEIEAALLACPAVREAVVLLREDSPGDKRLAAYVSPKEGSAVAAGDLRAHLRERLPEYMVPAAFVVLPELPLTANGKIDRRALPAPGEGAREERAHVAPRGPVEEAIADVFADVLGIERAGAHDGFFELGGHSLLATQAIARIRAALGVDLPLRAIFEAPTVAELAARADGALRAGHGVATAPMTRVPRTGPVALSFAQERMWFLAQLDPGDPTYNVPLAIRLAGALDAGALARAIEAVAARHEVLRTTIAAAGERPVGVVRDDARPSLSITDVREDDLRAALGAEARRPFDLATGPLLRAHLFRIAPEDHVLLFVMHHVVSDGWSLGVLDREIAAHYEAFTTGREPAVPALPIQYADYAAWQRSALEGGVLAAQLAYWKEQLGGASFTLDLPTDRPRPTVMSHRGAARSFALSPELSAALRDLSRREGATLFMTLLAAFDVLLHRLTGQDDIVVGSPIAGRSRAETEHLLGFFVNTLVLRTELSPAWSFRELVRRVREVCLGAYAHQDTPFERLVQELQPARDRSRTPLFQVSFTLQNASSGGGAPLGSAQRRPVSSGHETSKFDLALHVTDSRGALAGGIEFATDLFDGATIERMLAHFTTLLEAAVKDPDRRLWELSILPEAERRKVLVEWNDTAVPYPTGRLIHELFAEQAAKTPDAVALEFEAQSLTYRELDQRTNQLAHALRKRGIGPDSLVGVCMERSLEMVVALHATLKAGGAYVPLDPEYPRERLAFMLEDARPSVILTQAHLAEVLPPHSAELIRLDSEWSALAQEPTDAPARGALTPDHLAYVIYTSGSTGKPKGAMNAHRGILNRLQWMQEAHRLDGSDRVLQKTPFSFDVSVWEFFWPLMTGARLVVARPQGHKDPAYLASLVEQQGITTMHFVPSMLQAFLADLGQGRCPSLRRVFASGEALPPPLVDAFFAHLPKTELHNLYGPTEAAVDVTAWACAPGAAVVPIGKPIANTRIYLLDERLQPVPAGVRGELYIGGVQVARGYLNRAELTAERFLDDPFTPGGRLYRTGDVARWLPDGSIEYLGRADFQVKLRGFRIELGEIEAALLAHPAVREAVVLAREDRPGDKRLVAYVVGAADADELRAHLKARLPEYMVPGAFVALEALPLTASGKVDRRALPAPEVGTAASALVAPRNPVEEVLASLWAEVLGVPRVGVLDGFFELGGHSLLATRVVGRVEAAFGVAIPLHAMFEAPTVAGLAARIEAALRAEHRAPPPIEKVPREKAIALSFGQERLWFLDQLEPGDPSYIVPSVMRIDGALDADALARALDALAARHEVLRTTFATQDGQPVQVVHDAMRLALEVRDLGALPPEEREREAAREAAAEARRPFDLAAGPLVRARLLTLAPERHALLLTMHHIVSDAWSRGILDRELAALYEAFHAGRPSPLPDLPFQYADYAYWQRQWLAGEALAAELAYWKEQLAGAPPALDLPTDRPRPATMSHRGATRSFALSPELSAALRDLSRREGATLFMTMLAAFDVLLARYTGQDDIVVGSPIANRSRPGTEKLIGFFLNTLALRTRIDGAESFRALVRRVRATCLGAYAHQDMPFERLVQELGVARDMSRTPLFQVSFTLQNAVDGRGPALTDLALRADSVPVTTAKFDLTLGMGERGGVLGGSFEYATDLFDAATIDRMVGHLRALLEAAVRAPDAPLASLSILPEEERQTLLARWNDTARPYPAGTPLHTLCEEQADRSPDAIAIEFDAMRMTYRELDARSNRIAHRLRALGVGPDVLVGVCLERSLDLPAALLGVLKAGGAYVPIDPGYPRDRIEYMIADARAAVLLTHERLRASLPATGAEVVAVDADPAIDAAPAARPAVSVDPGSLAYVIYTSGSTGRPKGAMIPHRAIVNHMRWMHETWPLGPDDAVLQKTPISFDASVWEFWAPLMAGARLVMALPDGHRDPAYMAQAILDHRVTVLQLVPSMLELMLLEPRLDRCATLRRLFCGGEALSRSLVERFLDRLPGVEVVNLYGPTEAAIDSVYWICQRESGGSAMVPIGRPVANLRAHVLDRSLGLAPIGVPGELCLGGAGVGRGYWQRPELTAEKFVADPFSSDPEARLYRTGDLVRWLPSGVLEYLGRIDTQVKVRGFRIELGEIEAVLAEHPSVREAVVIAREGSPGDRRLAAYLVCMAEGTANADPRPTSSAPRPTVGDLRGFLKERLPEHMVPSAFVLLDRMPLLANGKIDRRSLPAPEEADRPAIDGDFVAPEGRVEEALAGIWASVLRLPKIGAHDNFFEIGGDSILSIQIVARARQVGIEITPRQIFQHQTIAELAAVAGTRAVAQAEQGPVTGTAPLTPVQRAWIDADPVDRHHFNQAFLFEVRDRLDPARLEAAIGALLAHHDALRLRLARSGDAWELVFAPPGGLGAEPGLPGEPPSSTRGEIPFRRIDLSGVPAEGRARAIERAAADAQASLDPANGPVVRAVLLDLGDEPARLLVAIHHLAVDGVSWRILLDDLWTAYAGGSLPPKTTSFKRWAEKLVEHARSGALDGEEDHWLAGGHEEARALPVDRADGENTEASARTVAVSLDAAETEALLREVPEAYRTQINDVLLTALAEALEGWTGDGSARIDLEGHGREEIFEDVDLTRTVGWFTAIYPVVLRLRPGGGPGEALRAIKDQLRAIPNRGVGYGMLRYLREGEVAERLRTIPRAEVSFNYLGQFDQAVPSASPIRVARESPGPSRSPRARRPYLVDVNASVNGGRLHARFVYSESRHDRGTIEALAQGFLAALRGLIEHCRSPEAGGVTASDFDKANVTEDLLDLVAGLDPSLGE